MDFLLLLLLLFTYLQYLHFPSLQKHTLLDNEVHVTKSLTLLSEYTIMLSLNLVADCICHLPIWTPHANRPGGRKVTSLLDALINPHNYESDMVVNT